MKKFVKILMVILVLVSILWICIMNFRPIKPVHVDIVGVECAKDGEFIINLPIVIINTKVGMYESLRPLAQYSMTLEVNNDEIKSLEFYHDEKSASKYKVVGKIIKNTNGVIGVKKCEISNQELFQSIAYDVLLNYDGEEADYIWPRLRYFARMTIKQIFY